MRAINRSREPIPGCTRSQNLGAQNARGPDYTRMAALQARSRLRARLFAVERMKKCWIARRKSVGWSKRSLSIPRGGAAPAELHGGLKQAADIQQVEPRR
jgi:hypothetical protein